jgi:hypothetical protein
MATINHKTYNEATETFKDFNVYDGKETLIFKVDGSEGNVGIGTSSPSNFDGLSFASPILDLVTSLNVRGRAADGAAIFNMGGETYRKAAIFTPIQSADPYLGFSVGSSGTSSNATEKMRITSAGNVGIGTNLPEGKLHVLNGSAGSVTANGNADELIVENSSTGGLSILTPDASTGYIMFGSPADNEGAIIRYQPTGTLMTIGTEVANGALAFRTATGTERMRITSAGNVGIGTSTANTLLSIDGAADNGLSIQGIGTTSTRAFFGLDTSGDGYLSLTNGSSFAKNVQLSSDLSVSNYILGNVGIGTSAPDAGSKLTVSGGIVTKSNTTAATTGALALDYLSGSTAGRIIAYGPSATNFGNTFFLRSDGTTTTESMRITSAGRVGIGTSAPNVQLEVSAADNSLGGIFRLNNNRTSLFDGDQNGSIQFSNNEVSGGANGVRSAILSLVRDTAGKTDLAFTTASTNAAATEKVRILAEGGLTFNGDTAAANALDDYEEGDITFALTFGGGSSGITYARNTGKYTKVGRQVTITGAIELTNKGTDTGNAVLTGLPFAVPNVVANFGSVALSNVRAITFADQIQAYVLINSSTILLNETTNAGAYTQLTDSDFANNSEFIINCSYFV